MIKKFNFYQIRAIKIPEKGKKCHENDKRNDGIHQTK